MKGGFGDLIFPYSAPRTTSFSFDDLLAMLDKSRASIYTVCPGIQLLGLSEEEKKKKWEIERNRNLRSLGINPANIHPPSKEVLERAKETQEKIKKYYPNGMPDAQEFLSNLSQHSGGWIEFLEEPEQADGIYNRILAELNTRYIIGYNPTNETKDGKRRTVKIEVKNHPEYKILGKTSYIAASND